MKQTENSELDQCLQEILEMNRKGNATPQDEVEVEIDVTDLEFVVKRTASAPLRAKAAPAEDSNPFSTTNDGYIELRLKYDGGGRKIPHLTAFVDWESGKGYMMGATPDQLGMYLEQLAKSGQKIEREIGEAILHPEYMQQVKMEYGEQGAEYVTATVRKLMQEPAKVVPITSKKSKTADGPRVPDAAFQLYTHTKHGEMSK
ncbi:hypothetical protein JW898_02440 [Candidatus Woesearchaeota archaeon]|nr:hypothetical protein [Candidatus Woesearchaeota archaeon]